MANKWTSIEMRDRNFDPMRQNLGYMTIYDMKISGDQDDVSLSIQSCSLPNLSNEEIEIPFGNDKFYVAGKRTTETFSVTFVDFYNLAVIEALNDWQKLIYDPETGKMGYAQEYKRSADIVQLTIKGEIHRTWELHGMWPQSVNYGNIDQTGTDKMTVEVTFRADTAKLL